MLELELVEVVEVVEVVAGVDDAGAALRQEESPSPTVSCKIESGRRS